MKKIEYEKLNSVASIVEVEVESVLLSLVLAAYRYV